MAALAIVTSLLPLIPRVVSLIQGAEDDVGPGRGEQKKNIVIDALIPFAKYLKQEGVLQGDIAEKLDEDTVGQLVELVFQITKGSGTLKEKKSPKSTPELPGDFKKDTSYPAEFQGTVRFGYVPK